MSKLNGRLKTLEATLAPPTWLRFWYQETPALADFAIHLEARGLRELTNQEWTTLTGLPFPHNLHPAVVEAHLEALALTHPWPNKPESALDHLISYYRWQQVKKEVIHLVRLAGPDQKRRFSEWADEAGMGTRLTKADGAYPDFWIAGKIIEHYSDEFIQDWIERNEQPY